MAKAFEGTDHEFYIDGYLQENLNMAKKIIKDDWDMLFVYDGMEGSGKSVKAMQDAFFVDPDKNLLDRYAFSPGQFRKAILVAKPYQAVIYDEAHSGLNARAAMSMINRSLVSMLTEIRQKNLFVFVILPTFFDLDKYVALWRSRLLIHVYTSKNMQRGFFSFYNASSKKMLYMKGKKLYKYGVQKPNFIGRFTNYYPLDEVEYRKRKRDALHSREKAQEVVEVLSMMYSLMWEKIMKLDNILTHNQKMAIMDMKPATYFRRLKQWKEMQPEEAPERESV
jgi:hypothetical protein